MALFIPLIVAHGIYSGIISSIGTVVTTSCSVVKKVYTHKNPDVIRIVKHLDLERRLLIVQSVLNTIRDEQPFQDTSSILAEESTKETAIVESPSRIKEMIELMNGEIKDPVELCLIFLRHSIQDIHDDLTALDAKVIRHKAKWFNTWRTLNVVDLLENLKSHSQQLDDRFNDLTKVTSFLTNRKIANLGV
jgi:hypothetical protein